MGLSPEEWRRALALSGASQETLDALGAFGAREPALERPPERLQQPMPRPQDLPPETQQALEKTGSKYRVPQTPDPALRSEGLPETPYGESTGLGRGDIPGNPYGDQRVSERPFDPSIGTKALQREVTAAQNESLNTFDDKTLNKQRAMQAEGDLAGGLAQERRGNIDDARQRIDVNREQSQAFERAAAQRLDRITAMVDNPPDQSKGMVLRIIGAVVANSGKFNGGKGGSGGGGIGAGLGMIGQAMAGDVKAWQAEIDANRGLHESLLAQSKNERGDSEHELKMTSTLNDLAFGVYDASLAQVRASAASEEEARVNDELRNGLRMKYAQSQIEINQMRAKAGAGAEQKKVEDELWAMPMDRLAQLTASGDLGKVGLAKLGNEIYAKRSKNSQDVRGGELDLDGKVVSQTKDMATIDNMKRESATKGPPVAAGLLFRPGATEKDKIAAQEAVTSQGDLDQALANMQRLQGSVSPQDKKDYDLNHKLAVGALNGLANAGVLNPGEVADWREKLPKHRLDNAMSPGALLVDEEEFLKTMRADFRSRTDRRLRTYNADRDTGVEEGDLGIRPLGGK